MFAPDAECVQVVVKPAHDVLDGHMQIPEALFCGNQDVTLDGRFDAEQGDFELENEGVQVRRGVFQFDAEVLQGLPGGLRFQVVITPIREVCVRGDGFVHRNTL